MSLVHTVRRGGTSRDGAPGGSQAKPCGNEFNQRLQQSRLSAKIIPSEDRTQQGRYPIAFSDLRFPSVYRPHGDLHDPHARRPDLEISLPLELSDQDPGRRGSIVAFVAPLHAHPVGLLVAGLDCRNHWSLSMGGHAALP